MHDIVDMIFHHPVIRTIQLQEKFNITYPTAKSDMKKLVAAGVLGEIEDSYPKAFAAFEVLEIAYGD